MTTNRIFTILVILLLIDIIFINIITSTGLLSALNYYHNNTNKLNEKFTLSELSHDTMSYNTTTFDDTDNTENINRIVRNRMNSSLGLSNLGFAKFKNDKHPCESSCSFVCTNKHGVVISDCVKQCKRNCVNTVAF